MSVNPTVEAAVGRLTAKFGDAVENGWASEANPTRVGIFVREFRRPRGQMNPGLTWEITDGKGKFWNLAPTGDHKITVTPADRATQAARIAELVRAAREGLICAEADLEARRQSCVEYGEDPQGDQFYQVFKARRDLIKDALAPFADLVAGVEETVDPARWPWLSWSGGAPPVSPETLVMIRDRNGDVCGPFTADNWDWGHAGNGKDIMAYGVHPAPPAAVAEQTDLEEAVREAEEAKDAAWFMVAEQTDGEA